MIRFFLRVKEEDRLRETVVAYLYMGGILVTLTLLTELRYDLNPPLSRCQRRPPDLRMSLSCRRYRKREFSSILGSFDRSRRRRVLETSEMSSSGRRRCRRTRGIRDIGPGRRLGRSILLDVVEINGRADGRLVITPPHQPPAAFAARNEDGEGPWADRQEDGMPGSELTKERGSVTVSQSKFKWIYSVLLTRTPSIFPEANCIPSRDHHLG